MNIWYFKKLGKLLELRKQITSVMALFLLLCILLPMAGYAGNKAIKKQYPPYSDVWGYDLSDYARFNDNDPSIWAKSAPNGDIVFVFDGQPGKLVFMNFFEGNPIEVAGDYEGDSIPAVKYSKKNKLKGIGGNTFVTFKDGTVIKFVCEGLYETYARDEIKNCMVKKGYAIPGTEVTLPDGENQVERLSMITIKSSISESKSQKEFGVFFEPRMLIELEDETFIAYSTHSNIILRLDKNLKTKFSPQHTIDLGGGKILNSNFFIIPYSKIQYFYEKVLQGYEGEQTLEVNRQLLNYLYEEQQKGNLNSRE